MNGLLITAQALIVSGLRGLQWKPAIIVLLLSLFGQAASPDFRNIPVTLHSLLSADYSADAISLHFPDLNLTMILDALGDRGPNEASSAYATLQSNLLTPVASVTPLPGAITQNPPTATPTATPVSTSIIPTSISTPSVTPSPTPSLTPTGTGAPTDWPTYPPQPTLRATLIPTKVKSTQPRPTATQSSHTNPTQTPAPPTHVPTPTRKPPTATKAPTATQHPHPYPGPTKPPYP
jgi:hypothetical protein